MRTYIAEQSENSITIGFKDANLTLITALISALNDDGGVTTVRLIDQHPELCDLRLLVQVSKGKPASAVEKASKAVASYYSSVKK
ncbi:MAG: hypothetical protein LBS92_02290 [Candidatus Methanoplasma sp.]|jgi:DNA-directed RNA polymerase subunit L|nr:hypothetical protein [Candidatus Methanoplasma sp.]